MNLVGGKEKCTTLRFNNGNLETDTLNLQPTFNPETGYKFLGILESSTFRHYTL